MIASAYLPSWTSFSPMSPRNGMHKPQVSPNRLALCATGQLLLHMAMHRMPDLLEIGCRSVQLVYMRLNGTSPFGRHYLTYLSMPSEHSSSEADAPANILTLGQRRQTLALERQRRRRGDDVGPTLFRRRLATSQDDANPTSGDDVGSTLFRRRLATSQYDAKPTSGADVGSTLFRGRLATSQYDAKPTSGDDVGSTLFPRR